MDRPLWHAWLIEGFERHGAGPVGCAEYDASLEARIGKVAERWGIDIPDCTWWIFRTAAGERKEAIRKMDLAVEVW
jgi:hypothetical protein